MSVPADPTATPPSQSARRRRLVLALVMDARTLLAPHVAARLAGEADDEQADDG